MDIPINVAKRWIECQIAEPIANPKTNNYTPHDRVSVVILVKDALKYFKQCLDSVVKNTRNYELIIVDNGSGPETKKYLADKQAELGFVLITNSKNKGFSYGNNQAIKAATSEYICFLNSDTVVTFNWLGLLMEGLKLPEAGAVGPSSCWVHGKQMLAEYSRYRTKGADTYIDNVEPPAGYEEFNYPDYLVGFCVLVKREVIEKIGGFDHHSFPLALGEDVDFSVRIARAGYKLYWIKGCYIHHYGSATICESKINWQKLAHDTRPALKANLDSDKVKIDNDVKITSIIKPESRVDVIIPVLDRQEETSQTLKSLFKNKGINVIVVDNGSDDLSYLNEFDVNIIKNKDNTGVTVAYNQGLKSSTSKYTVLMHNDIVVKTKDWIDKAVGFLDSHPDVGIVGQAGWVNLGSTGTYRRQDLLTSIDVYEQKPDGFKEVAVLDGCCNLIRNIGIRLDEMLDYFLYDFDLSLQFRKAGYKLYVMDGSAIHFADDRARATVSLGKYKNRGSGWSHAHGYFYAKWKGMLPLSV